MSLKQSVKVTKDRLHKSKLITGVERNIQGKQPTKQNKSKMSTMPDPDTARESKANVLDSESENKDSPEVSLHSTGDDKLHFREKDVLDWLLALSEEKLSNLEEIQQTHKSNIDANPANKERACIQTKGQRDPCAKHAEESQELAKNCQAAINFKKKWSAPKTSVTATPTS